MVRLAECCRPVVIRRSRRRFRGIGGCVQARLAVHKTPTWATCSLRRRWRSLPRRCSRSRASRRKWSRPARYLREHTRSAAGLTRRPRRAGLRSAAACAGRYRHGQRLAVLAQTAPRRLRRPPGSPGGEQGSVRAEGDPADAAGTRLATHDHRQWRRCRPGGVVGYERITLVADQEHSGCAGITMCRRRRQERVVRRIRQLAAVSRLGYRQRRPAPAVKVPDEGEAGGGHAGACAALPSASW